jgi:hypothetical protein
MEDQITKLEEFVGEFDNLFQEGVYFKRKDIERVQDLLRHTQKLLVDPFLNVSDDGE